MAQKLSIFAKGLLEKMTLPELEYFARLDDPKKGKLFLDVVMKEAERRKTMIYRLPEDPPIKLSIEKAALRGGVEAMYMLAEIIYGAVGEIERREKPKDE